MSIPTGSAAELRLRPEEAVRRLESGQPVLVLDMRAPDVWEGSRYKIQGALRVSPAEWDVDPSWPKDRFTLAYCSCPDDEASANVARHLRGKGFGQAYALEGGFDAWQAIAGPVEPTAVDKSDPRTPAQPWQCPSGKSVHPG